MVEPRIFMIAAFGVALVLAVALERKLARFSLSLPMVYVLAGFLITLLPVDLPSLNPASDSFDALTLEYVTEFIVIVSLASAGIAIDRPVSWTNWGQIWPMLAVAMPLTIAGVAFLGWWALALTPASAILLGAALAPTDPVLARSVQVGPPMQDERNDVRFSLTVEAGLNDGLAFPFTYLAIAAIGMTSLGNWTLEWAGFDLVWRIAAGLAIGWAIGRIGGWYVFEFEADTPMDEFEEEGPRYQTREGLVVLGTLLSAYAIAELIEGYGFLAVFVAGVVARQLENRSEYHRISHHFIDQLEHIVLILVLLGFGMMLGSGVLDALTWPAALIGLALIFILRPISGMLGLARCGLHTYGKFAIAFLGVRGMGSIYYLAYGQNAGDFQGLDVLWATVSFAILVSIVVHGLLAGPLVRFVERGGYHVDHTGEDIYREGEVEEAKAAQ
ncbi:Na+/H+ antiporter, CPA1 family protein [Erythrobacter sp. NAP1]|uniref:cation:proton antiporter n=1 Tax=Erythrobacter sp. NAP1 TaxID=237727 RepID=UPI0000686F28|nr:sodium:proton antiporter [Erythrobacter sp. NAP1]EAQ29159.1 Na+/H+ antiporter, CPA1 family protein [Erythrobacter sp. NAP1]